MGNPPFAGKNTLINGNREGYGDWLKALHEESHGNADLVAHFFRRTFSVIRAGGSFGLIATNTIGQGDTRASGLRWICTHGGTIYAAQKRHPWPGQASVVVSVVWATKGDSVADCNLNGRDVPIITAYLFHAGGHENPTMLRENAGKSYIGCYLLGMGFTFDDTDKTGIATPLAVMQELIVKDPQNASRIFPYLGGEEVNDNPKHQHHRFVINFADFPLRRADLGASWIHADQRQRQAWLRSGIVPLDYPQPVAADWPDLLEIVQRKVKPNRDNDNRDGYRRYWWQFAEKRVELAVALTQVPRVIVLSRVRATGFTFMEPKVVCSEQLVVFPFSKPSAFCVLQSRTHELWAYFFSASALDLVRYAPSDCFETFPFPAGFETNAALEAAGREYYEFRAALMQDLWLGLTEIYNLFHSPDDEALARLEALFKKRTVNSEWRAAENVPPDRSPLTAYRSPDAALQGVRRLRTLHAAMDTAVLTAYCWTDLLPTCTCEFLLDYEDEESESGAEDSGGRKKKKPWRYRWSDEVRDEVLARLLKLNAERAEEERCAGLADAASAPTKPKKPRAKQSAAASPQKELIPPPQTELFS